MNTETSKTGAVYWPAEGKLLARITLDGKFVAIFKAPPTDEQGHAMARSIAGEPEVAPQSTIAQLQARIGELESLHGEVYQVLGALDASAVVLDKVSAAANGESIPNTALLPYFPKGIQLPDKRQAMRSGDYVCGWNAAIDATAALNVVKS